MKNKECESSCEFDLGRIATNFSLIFNNIILILLFVAGLYVFKFQDPASKFYRCTHGQQEYIVVAMTSGIYNIISITMFEWTGRFGFLLFLPDQVTAITINTFLTPTVTVTGPALLGYTTHY